MDTTTDPTISKPTSLVSERYQCVENAETCQKSDLADFACRRQTRLRTIIDCDLLVLDDLFLARAIPDDAGALLQTLIHQRYKMHRSVIVTSNRVVQDWGHTSATTP